MRLLELKIPPLIVALVFATGIWFFPGEVYIRGTILTLVSNCFCIAGFFIIALAVANFKKEKTTVDPTNPEKSNKLVVYGVYKYSRNPMYLGFLLCLISLSLYFGNLSIVLNALFIFYINKFQIIPEEKILLKKFGVEYQAYKASVRRWI